MSKGNVSIFDDKIIIPSNKKGLEIEIRPTQDINFTLFNKVVKVFDGIISPEIQKYTVEISKDGVRKITQEDGKYYFQKKDLIKNYDGDYFIRLSIKREFEIVKPENFIVEITRKITRRTYTFNGIRADLSEVENSGEVSYEIEIEFINVENQDIIEDINNVSIYFFNILYGGEVYNSIEKRELFSTINKQIYNFDIKYNKDCCYIKKGKFTKLRNLKLEDLTFGGIVGGNIKYRISYKTDGERLLLVFIKTNVWLLSVNGEAILVNYDEDKEYKLSIIEGEYLEDKKEFWVFDSLVINDEDLTNINSHEKRINSSKIITRNLTNTDSLIIKYKQFHSINSVSDLFNVTKSLLKNNENLDEDGLVIIPENTIYNTNPNKHRLDRRSLKLYPDLCKWKRPKDITTDFLVLDGKLMVLDGKDKDGKDKYSPFKGSFLNEYKQTKTYKIPNNTIVEFEYDENKEIYVSRKIRDDKDRPNNRETASSNFDLVKDPIHEEIITGENTIRLVRKYHNRIKRELFNNVSIGDGVLLDIGSGIGGDLPKMKNFKKIYLVEPNKENIKGLEERIKKYGMENKVIIINTGGENFEDIGKKITEKVDVVSLMLSLSFFWESKEKLKGLSKTINQNLKEDGKIIYLSIIGESVKKLFGNKKSLTLDEVEMKYSPDKLIINIPNSIVINQTEYLVHLDDLSKLLNKKVTVTKADEEKLLSEDSKKFTELYSYGEFYGTNVDKKHYIFKENEIITIEGKTFTVKKMIEGINNIFHCINYYISENYRSSDNKKTLVNNLRERIANYTDDKYLLKYGGAGIYNNEDKKKIKNKLISGELQYKDYWFVSEIIKLNIVIYDYYENKTFNKKADIKLSGNKNTIYLIGNFNNYNLLWSN